MFLDQVSDASGRMAYRLAQTIGFPEFVKNASSGALCPEQPLEPHCYADPARLKYPCHTPAATWTSAAYFFDQKCDYNKNAAAAIEERLEKFAEFHDIRGALSTLKAELARFSKRASEENIPNEDFALTLDGQRHYPLRNPEEVKAAASYYMAWRDELPFETRRLFAERVLDKAASWQMSLGENHEELIKGAGRGAVAASDAAQALFDRVLASRRGSGALSELQVEMLKLAKLCLEKPSQTRAPGTLIKLAAVADEFDRSQGLHQFYGAGLQRVEDSFFAVTKEAMAELVRDNVETTTGNLYKLADLEKLRTRDVRDFMGEDYADAITNDGIHVELEKLAEVVPTMPKSDAQLFDVMCRELGVLAWGRDTEKAGQTLTNDHLRKLAAEREAS